MSIFEKRGAPEEKKIVEDTTIPQVLEEAATGSLEEKSKPKKVKDTKWEKIEKDIKKNKKALKREWFPILNYVEWYTSTGSIALDTVMWGWYKIWRIVELAWWESSGKTSLAFHGIREAQFAWMKCCFIDFERTFDESRAASCGVDISKLLIITPEHIEWAFETIRKELENGYKFFVYDSVWVAMDSGNIDNDMWSESMMRRSKVNATALDQVIPLVHKNNATLILINQYYETTDKYNKSKTKGGNKIPYVCSQRLELRRGTSIKSQVKWADGDSIGQSLNIKYKKCKVGFGTPYSEIDVELMYSWILRDFSALMILLNNYYLLMKEGNTYYYMWEKIGTKAATIDYCKAHYKEFSKDLITLMTEIWQSNVYVTRHVIYNPMVMEDDGSIPLSELDKIEGITQRAMVFLREYHGRGIANK